ncbi:MAG: nitronate monooxygenase family protein [bacterium]|nr:nitronate monooxygenase family protein [bacterium]
MSGLILGAEFPVIQGGMGVGISLSSLAGHVAKEGGVGIISTAQIGFREPDFYEQPLKANLRAIGKELARARELANGGMLGFNIMVATKNYKEYVKEAVRCGTDVIISGAGLPVSLPEYVREAETEMQLVERHTLLAPIVSSEKSASVICKLWDRKYKTVPDFVVIEGPLAGGHLGFSLETLHELGADTDNVPKSFQADMYEREIRNICTLVRDYAKKYQKEIPVILAGGIYDRADVLHARTLGVDGVQVATRFVTTEECDAPQSYKDAYIRAKKEDIVITKSPVGMPGRAIRNAFLEQVQREGRIAIEHCYQCLEKCDRASIPYCITKALVNAANGDLEHALLFCGSNAYRAEKMETVAEVMADLRVN